MVLRRLLTFDAIWIQVCRKRRPHARRQLPEFQTGRVRSQRCDILHWVGEDEGNLRSCVLVSTQAKMKIQMD